MKTLYAVLVAGIVGFSGVLGASAQEKSAPKIEGTYAIVGGVKDGEKLGEKVKETPVKIDAKTIYLGKEDEQFVIGYKVEGKASPAKVEMVILKAPAPFADAKGTPAYGLVAAKGDTLKLAYSLDKEKQPTDFSGKHGFAFELKKAAAK
ncbi:MAG: hypothetical protein U0804_06810 [Gemmataceae bacterium]